MKLKHLFLAAVMAVVGGSNAWAQIEAGDYYIQNVESGMFLNGANDWGTKASVTKHGQKMTVAVSGGKYTIDSHISNGGDSHFLAAGDNTYADGAAANHTITDLGDGTFSIMDTNNKYLVQNDGTKVNFAAANADANNAKWKFISMDDVATLMGTATAQAPVDATYFIGDANFSRNNQYYSNWVWAWGSNNNNQNHNKAGNNDNNVVESYHAQFSLTQTLTVPNGVYAITAQGFYRQDGSDNTNLPYFFANDEKKAVPTKTGSENSMANASSSFTNGLYTIEPIYVKVTDGTLNVGVNNMINASLWVIFDNFEMKYYGDVTIAEVLLAEYVKAYNDAMTAATTIDQAYLSEADKTALNTLIANNTVVLATATQEQLETATANLNADVPGYAYKANVGELASHGNNTDFTSLLVNPSFETGNMSGWTNNSAGGMWTMMTRANAADPKVGNYWIEKYGVAGKLDISQVVRGLPLGQYRVSVLALDQASKTKLVVQCGDTKVETAIVGGDKAVYTADIMLDNNSDLTIGLYCENHNANSWVGVDDFQLLYVSPELPALPATATGVMNATIEQAQTDALAAYNANKTIATYNAAVVAIDAAQKSVAKYAAADPALAAQKALVDGTNVYAEGWTTGYVANYNSLQEKYNNRTLNEEVVVNPNAATGWHASVAYNDLLTPWTFGGEPCSEFTKDLHVNTWSTEGDTDGSNFQVPFLEFWIGDAESLPNKTLAAQVTGLESGLYSVTAWVRVRAKNGVAATDATGVTLSVNGGTAIDATEGAQVGTSQFTIAEVTAEGKVADGELNIAFNIADANISWLSYKNVRYTKVRDLTPEELAEIEAAKIALAKADLLHELDYTVPTTNVGDEAFQYPTAEIAAVSATIATARGVYDNPAATLDQVNDQIDIMKNLTNPALNAPADGQRFHVAISYGGYRYSGHALQPNATPTNGVTVPLADNTANNNYLNDWTFTPVGGTKNGYTMSIAVDGTTYYVCTGAQDNGTNDSQIRMTTDPAKALTIVVKPTATEGIYNLLNTRNSNNTIGCQDDRDSDGGFYTTGSHNTLTIVEASQATATLSVTAAQYATFIAPFAAALPAEVKAYTVEVGAGNVLNLTEVLSIEANVPYVLFSESVVDENLSGWGLATAATYKVGALTGVYATTTAPADSYVLQVIADRVAFYQVEAGQEPTVGANRCFLNAPGGEAAQRAYFFGGEATAINALEALTAGKAEIFDANGVRQNKLQKGMNIVKMANGTVQKVLVK